MIISNSGTIVFTFGCWLLVVFHIYSFYLFDIC